MYKLSRTKTARLRLSSRGGVELQNFNLSKNGIIELLNDMFVGVESYFCYPGGELEGVKLSERNVLATQAGELVPAYTETHRRKNKYSVEFYKIGAIKAVALDEVQEIYTPIGEFPAEMVTFFESGELNRFFPLDGKISGFWSEADEKKLAIPLSFNLPFTSFTAIICGVAFYKNGDIRSITLFPGEVVEIETTYGKIRTRIGFSLYESGKLESLEPAVPVIIQTPIGAIAAFDPNAIGINADSNSLVFDEDGKVTALTTAHNRIAAQTEDGRLQMFIPREVINPLDNETMITEGLRISFDYGADAVVFDDGIKLPITGSNFTINAHTEPTSAMCNPSSCASCSLGCK